MRLTVELINGALSYLNPLHERELDLRGNKIPIIENLGAAGAHESIDFTDNDIATISNFPLAPRLQSLLFARNRITSIQSTLSDRIPNLHTLVLTQNNIAELVDLLPLRGFKNMQHLSIVDNPVASKENYRYFVIWLCPSIRFFDFQKVKDAERSKARELFGSADEPTDLARTITSARSSYDQSSSISTSQNGTRKANTVQYTDKEKQRFEKLVRNAKTLAEVTRLEKLFNEGRLPPSIADDDHDVMDET